jgi:hypothetical protein
MGGPNNVSRMPPFSGSFDAGVMSFDAGQEECDPTDASTHPPLTPPQKAPVEAKPFDVSDLEADEVVATPDEPLDKKLLFSSITAPGDGLQGTKFALPAVGPTSLAGGKPTPDAPGGTAPTDATSTKPTRPAGPTATHTVEKKETVWELSRRYNVSEKSIQEANNLPTVIGSDGKERVTISVGQKLIIPLGKGGAEPAPVKWTAQNTQNEATVLADLATTYHCSVEDIQAANSHTLKLNGGHFKENDTVFVPDLRKPVEAWTADTSTLLALAQDKPKFHFGD